MRIVIAGVPFSPNMGDGLIAALLQQQTLACVPGATIDTIENKKHEHTKRSKRRVNFSD